MKKKMLKSAVLFSAIFAICGLGKSAIYAEIGDSVMAIEADWLFQANGNPTKLRTTQEIEYAYDLIKRFQKVDKNIDFKTELTQLEALKSKTEKLDDNKNNIKQCYLSVRKVKRKITFKNPAINFSEILLIDNAGGFGGHESAHRNGHIKQLRNYDSGALLRVKLNGTAEKIYSEQKGFFTRPDLSFDGKKVLFGFKPKGEGSHNLYEINLNGTDFRRLTNTPYDDIEPIYLPDGHIMFCTTRGHTYVRCLPNSPSAVLARCDENGKNIYIVSRNNEPDFLPSLLPDGRVIYTRWEYTERSLYRIQSLWTTKQDGTGTTVYWGNNSVRPDMLICPQPIPGTDKVMFVAVGHHAFWDGSLGVIDINKGFNYPNGITRITTDVEWPEIGDHPTIKIQPTSKKYHESGPLTAYHSPYPISSEDFLVSARSSSTFIHSRLQKVMDKGYDKRKNQEAEEKFYGNWLKRKRHKPTNNHRFVLYLMDIHGNRELIYSGINGILYAQPIRSRKKPPIIPSMVKWTKAGEKPAQGTLYSNNIFAGHTEEFKSKAKYLRVVQFDHKTYSTVKKIFGHSGPAISVLQSDSVKRILGTIPIQPNGSVIFKVPPGEALVFQVLDEHYRCMQIMRSFTGVMAGETRGCLGCHELHSKAPPLTNNYNIKSFQGNRELTPPPWGADKTISFERFCQPILNKYCLKCHGNGKAKPDFRPKKEKAKVLFSPAYLALLDGLKGARKGGEIGPHWNQETSYNIGIAGGLKAEGDKGNRFGGEMIVLEPLSMLSSTSKLIKIAMSGKHHDVKVEGEDLRRLIAWVDTNCVYYGDKEARKYYDDPTSKNTKGAFDYFPVPPSVKNAPVIDRAQPFEPTKDNIMNP